LATWQFNIPDAAVQRVVDALAANGGYQEQIPDPDTGEMTANPQTKVQFARERVKSFIRSQVAAYESEQAASTARDAKVAEVEGLGL
jgi:hypothetical protein